MESALILEHKKLVDELSEGMEKAQQLQQHLSLVNPCGADVFLLQRIISCFENALVILNGREQPATIESATMDSPPSADESPRSYDNSKRVKNGNASKKRTLTGTRKELVRVNSKNGLEGPSEDGYSWRKYGQKDILGAKYPRSYYRCTYRLLRNCWAMKQVQRSDSDPDVFEVTYKGTHTCNQEHIPDPGLQPESNNSQSYQILQPNDKLLSMKTGLRVDTQAMSATEMAAYNSFQSTNFAGLAGEHHYPPIPVLDDDSGMNSYSSQVFNSPVTPDSATIIHNQAPTTTTSHASTTTEDMAFFPVYDLAADPNFLMWDFHNSSLNL